MTGQRRRWWAGVAVIAATVGLAACAETSAFGPLSQPPRVETVYARLLPGAVMPYVVTNVSSRNWEFGACSGQLERLDGTEWRRASGPCAGLAWAQGLSPGERLHFEMPLPDEVGIYRVRFRFMHFPRQRYEEVFVTSNAFRVGPASTDAAF